jgi:D-allose transport system substrate-binding protein
MKTTRFKFLKYAGPAALAALLGVVPLTAGTAGAQQKPVYGVLLKTLSNPYWGSVAKGVNDGAAQAGVEAFVQAAESDQAAEPQLNACNTMLERKPAVMLVAAINSTNLLPCLTRAVEQHVAVVNLDNNLDPATTKAAGVPLAFGIGSDNEKAGAKAADFIAKSLGGSGAKSTALVIEGIAGNTTSAARARGFSDELAKVAPGIKIIASLPGDWDRQKAANITNDTLQRQPDLGAIFACNDGMVLGTMEAARGAGNTKLVLVGVDGDADAIRAIKAGRLNATVAQLPYLMGRDAIANAKSLLGGKHVDANIPVPTLLITQTPSNDKLLQYLR